MKHAQKCRPRVHSRQSRSVAKLSFHTVFRAVAVTFAAFACGPHRIGTAQELKTNPATHADEGKVEGYQREFAALGTRVTLTAFHQDAQLVDTSFAEAQALVDHLGSILTDYDPNSETRRLSELACNRSQKVSYELFQVLELSDSWYTRTEGVFDSSLGQLTRLWRKYRRARRVPPPDLIQQALASSGWEHVQLDRDSHEVTLNQASGRPPIQFDFGAIGKGYIVDRVFELLQDRGLAVTLVNISGNMRCGAAPPDRSGWRIAIAPLEQDGEPLRRLALCNSAIATSGDLWQYIEIDGIRRSHILDPATGYGVEGPIAATAIASSAADADALATAACILPSQRVLEIAEQVGGKVLIAKRVNKEEPVCIQSPDFPATRPE